MKIIFALFILLFTPTKIISAQEEDSNLNQNSQMKRLDDYTYFSERYKDDLNLSEEQIKSLDDVEYSVAKHYHWDVIKTEEDLKLELEAKIMAELSKDQKTKYLALLKVQNEKMETQNAEYRLKKSQRLKDKYAPLELSPSQMQKVIDYHDRSSNLLLEIMRDDSIILSREERLNKLEELHLHTIFDDQQLILYKEENQEEIEWGKNWSINHTKAVFKEVHKMEITLEQASSFNELENISKDENGEYYSGFEKEDLKLEESKKFLDQKQFEVYRKVSSEGINQLEERIKESDISNSKAQADIISARLDYYIKNILPLKCKARKRIDTLLTPKQKALVIDLRKKYLDETLYWKTKSIKQHYRHNKDLAPNSLREILARMNYLFVRPILSHSNSLEFLALITNQKLIEEIRLEEQMMASAYEEEKAFAIISYEKNGGTYGFNLRKFGSDSEDIRNLLSLLLIDPVLENNLKLLTPMKQEP